MNKENFIKNILPQIQKASFTELSEDELLESAEYIWIYKSNKFHEHFQVNNLISEEKRWNEFSSIRSLNDHGYANKIKGITPKFFAIICNVLNITGADGEPLINYQSY